MSVTSFEEAIPQVLGEVRPVSYAHHVVIRAKYKSSENEYVVAVSGARAKVYLDTAHGPNMIEWTLASADHRLEILIPSDNAFTPGGPLELKSSPHRTPEVSNQSVVGKIYRYAVRVTFPNGTKVTIDPEYERDR